MGRRMKKTDRIKMETLLSTGMSQSEVARQLGFNQSTISREYKRGAYMHRNSDYTETEMYSSDLGQHIHDWYATGKGRPLKIGKDTMLAIKIEEKIVDEKYSPEAAIARLRSEGTDVPICVKTLYNYIDSGIFLRLSNANLPIKGNQQKREKAKRVQKRASVGDSIEKRPEEIESRESFGHWEMDTVKGKQKITKGCLLVMSERKTRMELIIKMPDQKAASVVAALDRLEQAYGQETFAKLFRTITMDNGVEFSDVKGIERSSFDSEAKRTKTYYCHAYSSWERGTNENINRMIRRHIPKGIDFDSKTDADIQYIQNWINNYPRRNFGFRCAQELYDQEIAMLA